MKRSLLTVALGLMFVSSGFALAGDYPADNSGKNVRDRDSHTVTSEDQSNDKGDVHITQEIRKAIVADKNLSTNAHNIKIITVDHIVTLRGPVKSAAEKSSIEAKAAHVAGVSRVKNDLEVASD